MDIQKTSYDQAVAEAVAQGLESNPKMLPSWLFYDETGDQLFRQIMRMPEYYPTRCEYDILQQYKIDLQEHFSGKRGVPFKLIELGAGDGLKTEILLRHFLEHKVAFTYVPVDISANVLELLSKRLTTLLPDLKLEPLNETYDNALRTLRSSEERKVILFMGANIGNFAVPDAIEFLKKLVRPLSAEDMLLIGFDLKKDPRIIQEAYDDPRGLTAQFNLNILTRLNKELGADFDPQSFTHFPYYDPATGATKSFLISMREQDIYFQALEKSVHFDLWEAIHTEVSQKYDHQMIETLHALTGLELVQTFYDRDRYFCDVLTRVASR